MSKRSQEGGHRKEPDKDEDQKAALEVRDFGRRVIFNDRPLAFTALTLAAGMICLAFFL